MKAIFLKPPLEKENQNIVRDFVYGCWCNGRRIGGMQMPPLNELFAATHARQAGLEILFMDAQVEPIRYRRLINERFAGVVCVVIMCSTQSFRMDVSTLAMIKQLNPAVKGILFGSHPTFMPRYCLEACEVDYIVCHEPEETLRCLLGGLVNGEDVSDMPGIGYRTETGEIRINPNREFIRMDALPIPDRSLLPAGVDYFNPVVKRMPYTTMQTSRGCLGKCIFCTAPGFYGNKVRVSSVERVVEELIQIKRLGYREVFFRDETFTAYKSRNAVLMEEILRRNIDLSWIANGRVDMVDKQMLSLMKKAGCHMLKFGVESGSDRLLKNYKKGITTEQTVKAFETSKQVGLDTHAHLVFGGPGETRQTIQTSIEFVKQLNPSTASFGILTPYPGSKLFDMVAEKKPEILDGSDSNMENLHVTGFHSESICGMSDEALSRFVVMAYRQFYLRPGYLYRKMIGVSSWDELMVLVLAGLNIFTFSLTGQK